MTAVGQREPMARSWGSVGGLELSWGAQGKGRRERAVRATGRKGRIRQDCAGSLFLQREGNGALCDPQCAVGWTQPLPELGFLLSFRAMVQLSTRWNRSYGQNWSPC